MCRQRLAGVVMEVKNPGGDTRECFRLCDQCAAPLYLHGCVPRYTDPR